MPTYIKPSGITGLNTGHSLYADLHGFLELGQLNKDLLADTALTTTAGTTTDAHIGSARSFASTADAITETLPFLGEFTVLVVYKPTGTVTGGDDGNIEYVTGRVDSGNKFGFVHKGFNNGMFSNYYRGGYDATTRTLEAVNLYNSADPATYQQGHCAACVFSPTATMQLVLDGSADVATNTQTTTVLNGGTVMEFMQLLGATASVNVGAIVVFNRALSVPEMEAVTADPWAMVAFTATNNDPTLDTPEPDFSISSDQSGVVGTVSGNMSDADSDPITYSIVSGAPVGITMAANGDISANGSVAPGVYTITYQGDDLQGGTPATDTFDLTVTDANAEPLDANDVVARYLLDEAASGASVATIADDTGNGTTLSVGYGLNGGVWESIASGRGFNWPLTPASTSAAKIGVSDVTGTSFTRFNAATQASFELVANVVNVSALTSRLFQLGTSSGDGSFALGDNGSALRLRWGADTGESGGTVDFPSISGDGLVVIHGIIDTTQVVADNRVRIYVNGVEQVALTGTIPQNTSIIVDATRQFYIGNRGANDRSMQGSIYYLAVYDKAMSPADVATSYSALASDNDTAGLFAVPDTTAPTYTQIPVLLTTSSVGHTFRFTANENCTYYAVRHATGGGAPSVAQVKAGQDETGAAALEVKTGAVSANVEQQVVFNTGSPSTTYDYSIGVTDAAGNDATYYTFTLATSAVPAQITNVTGDNFFGGTITVTTDGTIDATGAVLTATYGGVALATPVALNATTVTCVLPTTGFEIGSSNSLIVTMDGASSDAYSVSMGSALGGSLTFTVGFSGLHPDSPLNKAAYSNLAIGDQLEFSSVTTPGGYTLTVSDIGLFELSGAGLDSETTPQAVDFALIDASDSYARSNVSTITLVPATDGIGPEITLLGNNPMTVEVLTGSYIEPGAAASDNLDGDISGSITITGAVNTNVIGLYQRTYSVTDSDGNTTQAVRNINVVDTVAPVITLLGEAADTLVGTGVYSDPGVYASDNYDGDITRNVVVTGSVGSGYGLHYLYYNVEDSSGNAATQVIRTVTRVQDTVNYDLTVDDSRSITTLDSVSLGVVTEHNLTVNDARSLTLLQEVTLDTAIPLTADDISSATTLDAVALSFTQSITVLDVWHGTTLDNVSLTFYGCRDVGPRVIIESAF